MRVLVTGADGRLARATMGALRREVSVVAVDTRLSAPLQGGIEFREGDLRDTNFVGTVLAGVDAVLHLAPLRRSPGDDMDALDEAARGAYVLSTRAMEAGVGRMVVGSTLDLFDRLPADWDVSETWRPRPEPRIEHLRAWLAELSVREVTRVSQLHAICLRFGRLVDDAEATSLCYDPRWLHVDDAVEGVRRALASEAAGWSVFHITAAGSRPKVRLATAGEPGFGYRPTHDFRERWGAEEDMARALVRGVDIVLAPVSPVPSRPVKKVVIFGAGGPLAAAAASKLAPDYTLRLTDVRPIWEIAAEGPRKDLPPGTPIPVPLNEPHECRVVDVTSPGEVTAACEGMDAIVNCTVIRHELAEAFRVNTLGAHNIARAAVSHGIRRVVHTGPQLVTLHGEGDYTSDYDIPAEAPPRPGRHLYGHSKYLGQEVLRVFADYYGLEVPVLLFTQFVQPEMRQTSSLHPFAVSWRDAARAIHRALEAPMLRQPLEVLHVCANLPHGAYTNFRAKEVLGWQPHDDLRSLWQDTGSAGAYPRHRARSR